WFTDHYRTAHTCTHRTYSRGNCRPGDRSYGGGPASAHNFTTGLLHYHYLTGDPDARAAVLSLADWVVNTDDGRRNVLGKADAGEIDRPYAYAQASLVTYAAWMADHEVPYFDQAEKLEFPTESWAAQELRKANVLRLAAAHADEPLRSRMVRRGTELADRG